jgi:hypothetical protein
MLLNVIRIIMEVCFTGTVRSQAIQNLELGDECDNA